MPTETLTPCPDLGKRPQLLWIDVDRLTVDPRYQRTADSQASKSNIARIVEKFSWRKFQALTVTPTGNLYAVLDGQHRWEAAKLHPMVMQVPCLVVEAPELRQQADSFVGVNLDRVAMNPFHLHKARVIAGDPDALHIQEVCDRAGIVIPKTNLPVKDLPPRGTLALTTIRECLRNFGDAPTVAALSLLGDAFPKEPGSIRASLIKGMTQFFLAYKGQTVERERLIKILANRGAVELEKAARAYKDNFGGTTASAIRAAVTKAYNERLPAEKRLPEQV